MSTRTDKARARTVSAADVWAAIRRQSFAIVGFNAPGARPRTSGVVYAILGNDLYVAVAPDSWKARFIAVDGRVSVTIPVRRGGPLSLIAPIPPATITFPAHAEVFPPGSPEMEPGIRELGRFLPPERRERATLLRIRPEGEFVTYGIGVRLMQMRDVVAARGRVPVA
jgi:hypothetical protein